MSRGLTFLCLVALVALSSGECLWEQWSFSEMPNATTQDWSPLLGGTVQNGGDLIIDSEAFDEYFWSDPYKYRPSGYKYTKIHAYNEIIPCVNVTKSQSYGLEVMVYAFTNNQVCIKDLNYDAFNSQSAPAFESCDDHRTYKCFIAESQKTTSFAIYSPCESGCEDGKDIGVLYRLRHSEKKYTAADREFTTDNTEMWCMMISATRDWPEYADSVPGSNWSPNIDTSGAPSHMTIMSFLVTFVVYLFN